MSRQLLITVGLQTLFLSAVMAVFATAHPGEDVPTWQLRSRHFRFGMPVCVDSRYNLLHPASGLEQPGISVLVREGFVVGHCDLMKAPLWVAQEWRKSDYSTGQTEKTRLLHELGTSTMPRRFKPDLELPDYARADKGYDYAESDMEQGHMARHEDNISFGADNLNAGCLMSNITPQHKDMNGEAWNDLENLHRDKVLQGGQFNQLWVISGSIYPGVQADTQWGLGPEGDKTGYVGNDVGVPDSTYKVVYWINASNRLQMRGYIVHQEDRVRDEAQYLVAVDTIEELTGLDFFPELDPAKALVLEAYVPADTLTKNQRLWGNMPTP